MARIILVYDPEYAKYANTIKTYFSGHQITDLLYRPGLSLVTLMQAVQSKKVDYIFFSSPRFLSQLLTQMFKNENTFTVGKNKDVYKPYWGAAFSFGRATAVCLPEFDKIYTMNAGEFLIKRYISKTVEKDKYITAPKLHWELVDASKDYKKAQDYFELFQSAILIATDIETAPIEVDKATYESEIGHGLVAEIITTKKTKPIEYKANVITCVGYSGLFKDGQGNYYSRTVVFPYIGNTNYEWIKKFNRLPAPKALQNGRYDAIHEVCNNLPFSNWTLDTYGLMHSYYAELPRSLEFIAGFFLRNYMYWKDESGINLYEYNAKDCHQTLWACVAILQEYPDFAHKNYAENFIQIFPCITCSLEGFAVDWEEYEKKKKLYLRNREDARRAGELVFGEGFNPSSPVQVKKVIQTFGLPGAKSSDSKSMQKFADISTWHERLINYVLKYREASKMYSTYFQFPFLGGRYLFDLDPFGTETGRYASKKSSLWVGQQGQNFPHAARSPYICDSGYHLNASDNAQSESRCTAYMSEDKGLMHAVEHAEDFHKHNASMFFGMPVEEVSKEIRKLGKKVNHGANYNMGWKVLSESMGTKNVLSAKKLLKLPREWGVRQVCEHLLSCFDNAYPDIRGKYYSEVINEVHKTGKLVGPTGWTRVCFGNPAKSKPILNAYVAHGPQSLSVKVINRAFFTIWYRFQFKEKVLRMKMQKHDEIIWQNKPEHTERLGSQVESIMAEPTIVRGRKMVIPNDPELGLRSWGDFGD